ncbi:heptaprenylglyceryl phosphate synthase [Paenibacillus swuensis]|uniref:Heptaprenylglyceryl phosphate synthase n=2 Tax=Paenibacillus swuensis TaxID=1178515 RepID=A0A172TPA1_9BACL|nr:heptaprenylglyceryl phosphate synthase [Paenibacillus swuensis]
MKEWKHVFKLDPDREISDEDLDRLCMSGTDAVIVGGSSGVTYDNTVDLLSRIRKYTVPVALEISVAEAVVPAFDLYFIPVVLNTSQGEWITGRHQQAVKEFNHMTPWEEIASQGYVVLNPDSAVGKLTGAQTDLDAKDVAAYAQMAEHLFRMPIFYVEYSGMFGDMNLVRKARNQLTETRLFYGGGIDCLEKAEQAAEAAHTIVVGNVIYENLERALETVRVKEGQH